MIVNHDKKIVILLTPKTGSTTVRTIFEEWFTTSYGSHANYDQAVAYLKSMGVEDTSTYTFYAFYRNPIDRLLSALTGASLSFIQLFPVRSRVQEFIDATFPDQGLVAPKVATDERDTSVIEPFYALNIGSKALPSVLLKLNTRITAGLVSQLHWVGNEAVNMLCYEQYEDNVKFLCEQMGVEIPLFIPRENESVSRWQIEDLPESEVDFIREYYKKDYVFFKSKGIIY